MGPIRASTQWLMGTLSPEVKKSIFGADQPYLEPKTRMCRRQECVEVYPKFLISLRGVGRDEVNLCSLTVNQIVTANMKRTDNRR